MEKDGAGGSSARYRRYTIEEIEQATAHFDDARKVGEGGYGPVYNGYLDHTQVAIKVLRPDAAQGKAQFQQEVEVLSCIRHPNMVLLLGACPEYGCLVYEYMENGTLFDHLHADQGSSTLSPVTVSWRTRVEVLLGVSRAIEHLHRCAIIHGNVSSSNILLDASWTPRLSGFGAAILQAEAGGQVVAEVVGTPGYVDPEYGSTRRVSLASDVYSFGVLILAALTGEDPATLVDSALPAIRNEKLPDVLDSRPATPSAAQLEALELVACTAGGDLPMAAGEGPAAHVERRRPP